MQSLGRAAFMLLDQLANVLLSGNDTARTLPTVV